MEAFNQKNDKLMKEIVKLNEEMAENCRAMTEKMSKKIAKLEEGLAQKNEENVQLKEQNAKLQEEMLAMKKKLERIDSYIPQAKKLLISRALPAELLNELFASLPVEKAYEILPKMPNGILARNVRKMLKSIEMAMRNNKWNEAQCGSELAIFDGGRVVKHSGSNYAWNSVRAQMAIPKFNLNSTNALIAYFETEIVAKRLDWCNIAIGFCTQQFPLEGNGLGGMQNSIGICYKGGIWIDGTRTKFANAGGLFAVGEIIGIGILHFQSNSKMKCFASCNGNLLAKVDLPIKFADFQLFPAVSMYFANDSICANFGEGPFRYDPREIYQNL